MAKKRQSAHSSRGDQLKGMRLGEFILNANERNSEPVHLQPFLDLIERSEREPVRAVVSVPCQHGKTTVVQHAIPWLLLRDPRKNIAYATYSKTFAARNSKTIRRIAEDCGLQFSEDQNTISEWQTDEGGGCIATSVDGELTGMKVNLLFVDDPYKNRAEAESFSNRQNVEDWMRGVALTRVPPSGSVIIVMSRWCEDDLAGVYAAQGWEVINLPAINEQGEALCPWGPDPNDPRTLEFLLKLRKDLGEYDFQSLYMGSPKPPAGQVFQDPTFGKPHASGRRTIGIDLSYADGRRNDKSVALAYQVGDDGVDHVLDVWTWKGQPTEHASQIRAFMANHPGAKLYSYVSGPETAIFELLRKQHGIPITLLPATGIGGVKLLRAQKTAAQWNDGKIQVPDDMPWVAPFTKVVKNFTGKDSDSDDEVDALVSARDGARNYAKNIDTKKVAKGRRRR